MLRRANEGNALATDPSTKDALVLEGNEVIFIHSSYRPGVYFEYVISCCE